MDAPTPPVCTRGDDAVIYPCRNRTYPNELTSKRLTVQLTSYTGIHPGQKVLVYKPHQSTDGPNPKFIQPWRGPYIICSKVPPVVYRIRLPDDTKQVSVYLGHIKTYRSRQSAPAPDFHKLEKLFVGKTLPTPALEESDTALPHIGIYQIADVVGHRRGYGRHNSSHNYIYRLRLKSRSTIGGGGDVTNVSPFFGGAARK